MPTFFLAGNVNYLQKTLNGSISSTVTTITLNNTTDMPGTGYITVDRINSSSVATPNSREVISYTGISGNDLTGVTRGADGSTARSHNDAAIVEVTPTIGMWNNLATIVSTGFTSDGYLRAINSPVTIGRGELTTLAVSSAASIAQLNITNLVISNLTVTNAFLASGASVTGSFLRSKVITATRDLSAANGNVGYTGVGFTPTSIHAIAALATTTSMGFSDSAKAGYQVEISTTGIGSPQGNLIYITPTPSNAANADVASYDGDGFTLTWTKVNSPTTTAQLRFLCLK